MAICAELQLRSEKWRDMSEWPFSLPLARKLPRLRVSLDKLTVTIKIDCKTRYAALELYDSINKTAEEGTIHLELPVRAPD